MASCDEWWIVGDGDQPVARRIVDSFGDSRLRYFEHHDDASQYGNAQRNLAMTRATADYFVFLDDDDVLLAGALDAIRREATSGLPLMFRMDYRPARSILWRERVVRQANVSGAMFVIPNKPGCWAPWPSASDSRISDLKFITDTLALWPADSLRWCEDVIYLCDARGKGMASEQVGLPYSFDEWRARRHDLPYAEHVAYFDAIFTQYPHQHYCSVDEARAFAAQLPDRSHVLEVGGWRGQVAEILLPEFARIEHWHNFELSRKAVQGGLTHPRFTAQVAADFVWKIQDLPECNVLFAAHVLEHLSSREIRDLLGRLRAVTHVFVEAPLPVAGKKISWAGNRSTAVLDIGWRELEELFGEFGFQAVRRARKVRFFERSPKLLPAAGSGDVVPRSNSLGKNVYLHPTANVYRATIGDDTKVAAFVEIGGSSIGARCKVQAHAFIPPGVVIDDEVFVGPGVRFTNDPYPKATGNWTAVRTRVERGASIGAGAIILPGVTVGAGAQVGAGSVVTSSVPPGECVAGNPARTTTGMARADNARDCLVILQPREIPTCIESLRALPIDRVWFRAYSEEALAPLLNRFIRETRYRNYILCADDVVVHSRALAIVRNLLKTHPTSTGYCRIALNSEFANVTKSPVTLKDGIAATWDDYEFYTMAEIQRFSGEFVTWFGGWALTGMRRELWLQYPFCVNPKTRQQSDFETAHRLGRDGRCFYSHPDACIEHLRPSKAGSLRSHWLVGNESPSMKWEFHEPAGS
jgi:acetyltransferase-like isoleucine patch superfamily enzyme